jgi:hypothetical protein
MWIYTRWGAFALDVVIDRRAMVNPDGGGWQVGYGNDQEIGDE